MLNKYENMHIAIILMVCAQDTKQRVAVHRFVIF